MVYFFYDKLYARRGNEKKLKERLKMRLKNTAKKIAMAVLSLTMVSTMLTGCSNGQKEKKDSDELSGSIMMVGSTSMEKLALAVAEDFMNKHKGVKVTAEFVGSSAGVEAVINKTSDIGNASRNLKDSEIEKGAVENIVAIDGIAVVVNNANKVSGLTKEQLIAIYKGEIKNWKEVDGNDSPIVVIGREAGSGTRGAFEEILKVEDACAYANELDNTGAVMAKVASTEGAIGYISLDVVDDTVKALALDQVTPNADNVASGSYSLSRPFVMATNGSISEQSELVQAFFEYMNSEDGKAVIKSVGLVLAK